MKFVFSRILQVVGMLVMFAIPAMASAKEPELNVYFNVDKTTQRIGPMTIKSVRPDSSASRAGVRIGDVVLRLDGFPVTNAPIKQLVAVFEGLKGKKKYSITVVHGIGQQPLTVEIEKGT